MKKNKTPTYNMSLAQIQQMKANAAREAVQSVIELTLGLPTMILHDKFGFGQVRLNRFLDETMALYQEYEEGRLSLEDVRDALWDEGGYKIQRKEKSKWK